MPCTVVAMHLTVGERRAGGPPCVPHGEAGLRSARSASSSAPVRYDRCVYEEHQHRNISGGGARAAVFGISDGLVSNVSLILGMAGANSSAGAVRLAGLAGLIGGASVS